MARFIWSVLVVVLNFNARLYGRGSSHELCRDLAAAYREVN